MCSFLPKGTTGRITQKPVTTVSLVAEWQRICLPRQETRVQSPVWEEPLEKEIATYSSILAWGIPWTEEPGATVHGVAGESDMTEWLSNNSNTFLCSIIQFHPIHLMYSLAFLRFILIHHGNPRCKHCAPTFAPLYARSELSFLCRSCCRLHALCPLDTLTCLELFCPSEPSCFEFGPDPQNTIFSLQFFCYSTDGKDPATWQVQTPNSWWPLRIEGVTAEVQFSCPLQDF